MDMTVRRSGSLASQGGASSPREDALRARDAAWGLTQSTFLQDAAANWVISFNDLVRPSLRLMDYQSLSRLMRNGISCDDAMDFGNYVQSCLSYTSLQSPLCCADLQEDHW